MPRDDLYKSGEIHTGPGEPANSVSKPTPRPKQVAARPVTTGKLLRPGGPGGGPSKLAARPKPAPAPQPLPQSRPQHAAVPTPKPVPQPVSAVAAAATAHNRTASTGSVKAPPPPPPPVSSPTPKKPTAKALYDFNSDQANELSVRAGEIVQIVSREGNGKLATSFCDEDLLLTSAGWWLCMNLGSSVQGWAPEAYLEEQAAPTPKPAPPPPPPAAPRASPTPASNGPATAAAAKAKPAPPAPPAKRPNMAGRKTVPAPPPAPRDSAVSMEAQESNSGRATPSSASNASLAGGLAEALRARQSAMRGKQDEDDEW